MIHCLHCHDAETTNGLALCDLCQRYAHDCFELLPIYYRNLARWRPGRTGARQVPGSRVLYDGTARDGGDRIADALDQALNALTTWARVLTEARTLPQPYTEPDAVLVGDLPDSYADHLADHPDRTIELLCIGFDHHLTSIATTDWCGEFLRVHDDDTDGEPQGIGYHEARLRALTETAVPGWYAGSCRCGIPTYVVPGLTWSTCRNCGTSTAARDHLDVILDEARDWTARPKPLAEAIVALVDTEPSVPQLYDRIRQWAHRGDLPPVQRTVRSYSWDDSTRRHVLADVPDGPASYRLGDVLDLVLAPSPRRARSRKVVTAS